MSSSTKKIGWVLLAIFLLPVSVLTVYEVSSLNRNEEIMEDIYSRQLDAILFSINQYSQDVASNWSGKVGQVMRLPEKEQYDILQAFVDENISLRSLFITSNIEGHEPVSFGEAIPYMQEDSLTGILETQQEKLGRLKTYLRGGYQKIEPVFVDGSAPLLLFLIDRGNEEYAVCGIFVNPEVYVEQVLVPRIQQAAAEKFIISVYQTETKSPLYSTLYMDSSKTLQTNELWLLPGYTIGVAPEGNTLQNLIQERAYSNLSLIIGVNILMLLGIIWVFRNLRRELRLAQNKSDFVSNVSHEIRTPLALISMFAETLEMDRVRSEEKKHEYYRIISQETNRLSGIVNKILNFSKMEAGKRSFQLNPTNLNELSSEILDSYEFHLKQNGFELQKNLEVEIPMIQGDREAISEALINLIDNAMKYSKEEKLISVRTGVDGQMGFLEVEDHGMGIPEDQHRMIFEKFYRVASGPVHNTKGTGLGLSLVHHIMEGHGGSVSLRSKVGMGSSFRLNFPLPKTKNIS